MFINDLRYEYASVTPGSLTEGHYTFVGATIYVYGNPGSQPTFVSVRSNGFYTERCDYVTIDGFTTLRTTSRGIQIVGASNTSHSTWITVTNCTSAFNWRHGIYLKWTSNSSVLSNTTHTNVRHGIYLINSDSCQITRNVSYGNEDPAPTRDGIAGIKVGESSVSTDVSDVTVDYNIVRDNEDTGIDLNGAQRILVRRNVSYHNRDHGYDNNATDHTVFLNNVAANNDHDGISVEGTSTNVEIYNCILAYNARNGTTLAPGSTEDIAELWVHGIDGFASNHNMLFGYGHADFGNQVSRGLVEYNGTLYDNLSTYQGASGRDANSRSAEPMFADTVNGNYVISSSGSEALACFIREGQPGRPMAILAARWGS